MCPKWASGSVLRFARKNVQAADSICLGLNRNFLWLCNRISPCATRISHPCRSKALFGRLYCPPWILVSQRSNWHYLSRNRIWLHGSGLAERYIASGSVKRGSDQQAIDDSLLNSPCIFCSHLDSNLRCQNFLSGVFQEAHSGRDQDSHIFLDRGSHHINVMGIRGGTASHNLPAS